MRFCILPVKHVCFEKLKTDKKLASPAHLGISDQDDWDDMDNNMWDYGLVIGGRYTMNEQMSLVGTYYMGLAEWGDDMEYNNRSIQIGLAFGL